MAADVQRDLVVGFVGAAVHLHLSADELNLLVGETVIVVPLVAIQVENGGPACYTSEAASKYLASCGAKMGKWTGCSHAFEDEDLRKLRLLSNTLKRPCTGVLVEAVRRLAHEFSPGGRWTRLLKK